MKVSAAVMMLTAWAAGSSLAGSVADPAEYPPLGSLSVCMDLGFDVQALTAAEKLASRMYARIGLEVRWLSHPCAGNGAVVITLSYHSSPEDHPGSWAYAMPYDGTRIVVFWDRVQEKMPPDRAPILLAHVLVHEIAHILQGVSRHSETGLMKAGWNGDDLFTMTKKPLEFTDEDVALIRLGFEPRNQRALNLRK